MPDTQSCSQWRDSGYCHLPLDFCYHCCCRILSAAASMNNQSLYHPCISASLQQSLKSQSHGRGHLIDYPRPSACTQTLASSKTYLAGDRGASPSFLPHPLPPEKEQDLNMGERNNWQISVAECK